MVAIVRRAVVSSRHPEIRIFDLSVLDFFKKRKDSRAVLNKYEYLQKENEIS